VSGVLILGIGSPAGDDQAGWLVVDALSELGLDAREGVVLAKLDRPGANLVAKFESAEHVVLIDAMQSGESVGSIRRFDQRDWPGYRGGLSSHGFGVAEALALARELGSLPRRLDLYGIEIGSVNAGDAPGEAIRAAAQGLARQIVDGFLEPRRAGTAELPDRG
jgi:hydrogenase maturation protease